jgi:hypothetical protein
MPKGAAVTEGSSGESISHFAAVRVRVTGVGNLRMRIYSLDDVKSKIMVPFVMNTVNRIIPTRIINFMEQRASIELKTTEMDERFRINRIIVFTKEIYSSYPGS